MNFKAWMLKTLLLTIFLLLVIEIGRAQEDQINSDNYVTGTVTRSTKPVSNYWVIVYQSDILIGRSITGDDGKYYIGHLDKGTYTIVVRKKMKGNNLFTDDIILPDSKIYDIKIP